MSTTESIVLNTTEQLENTSSEFDSILIKNARILRVVSITFSFLAITYLFYVIVAMAFYAIQNNYLRSRDSGKTRNEIPHVVIIFGLIMAAANVSTELPLIKTQVEPFCAHYLTVKIITYALTLAFVYMALWFRVYITFYVNPVMRQVASKFARFVNMLALAFWFVAMFVNSIVFFTTPTYRTKSFGCTPTVDVGRTQAKWIVLAVCTLTFQGLILFSFVYPLYLNHRRMISSNSDVSNLIPIIRRATVTAAVCIVSDIINSIYGATDHRPLTYVRHMVFSTNLMVNVTAVIFLFADWKKRLYPFEKYFGAKPNTAIPNAELSKPTVATNLQTSSLGSIV